MKKLLLLTALSLTACVTINIYFPAAAAEKAADEIIKDIQTLPPEQQETLEPKSELEHWQAATLRYLDTAIGLVITSAQADSANLSIDRADIRQWRASMENRFPALKVYYDKGIIGLGADGFITLRNPTQIPLKDRNPANKLVRAENADRRKLYRAIADANGHPEWADKIQSTFASRWISNAQSGWWYQTNGGWKQR